MVVSKSKCVTLAALPAEISFCLQLAEPHVVVIHSSRVICSFPNVKMSAKTSLLGETQSVGEELLTLIKIAIRHWDSSELPTMTRIVALRKEEENSLEPLKMEHPKCSPTWGQDGPPRPWGFPEMPLRKHFQTFGGNFYARLGRYFLSGFQGNQDQKMIKNQQFGVFLPQAFLFPSQMLLFIAQEILEYLTIREILTL